MKKISRLSKNSKKILSLNENREDAWWQIERGPRYGNSRKARSKAKKNARKIRRNQDKIRTREIVTEFKNIP